MKYSASVHCISDASWSLAFFPIRSEIGYNARMTCPCGSQSEFETCCQPLLRGDVFAKTAEQLMRSRYSAYVTASVDYLRSTLAPESRGDFDAKSTEEWAKGAQWKGLEILSTSKGKSSDRKGIVEFTAHYVHEGEALEHHEVAHFRKSDEGRWYFVDGESHTHKEGEGHHEKPKTVVREAPKVGRNDPCPCQSGKKYKKCCAA